MSYINLYSLIIWKRTIQITPSSPCHTSDTSLLIPNVHQIDCSLTCNRSRGGRVKRTYQSNNKNALSSVVQLCYTSRDSITSIFSYLEIRIFDKLTRIVLLHIQYQSREKTFFFLVLMRQAFIRVITASPIHLSIITSVFVSRFSKLTKEQTHFNYIY